MIRVLFVVPTLGVGGVERALLTVLQRLDRQRFEPALCVLADVPTGVELPRGIPVIFLKRRSRWSFGRLVLGLRRLLTGGRYDVAVGFSGVANFALLGAARVTRARVGLVVTEHIAPTSMYGGPEEPFGWIKNLLIRILYPRADRVVAVSQGVAGELESVYGLRRDQLAVVHTPVELAEIPKLATADIPDWPAGDVVVSVGRLTKQKNHQLLLHALARLAEPPAAVIVGDGPERAHLEALAQELGLGCVVFVGATDNPYPYIASANLFALPSRFEGFGIVLVEALALGRPIVATDCSFGPAEILCGGEYGVLVPVDDADALAAAISGLLTDPERLRTFAERGPARAAELAANTTVRELEREIENAALPPTNRQVPPGGGQEHR